MVTQKRLDSRVTVGHSRTSPTVPIYGCGSGIAPYKTVCSCLLGVLRPGDIFGLPDVPNNGLFQLLTLQDTSDGSSPPRDELYGDHLG